MTPHFKMYLWVWYKNVLIDFESLVRVSSSRVNHKSKHNSLKCTVRARRPTHRHTNSVSSGTSCCDDWRTLHNSKSSDGAHGVHTAALRIGLISVSEKWCSLLLLLLLVMVMMQRSLPVYTVGGSGQDGDADVYQLLTESVDQLRHRLGGECTVCV